MFSTCLTRDRAAAMKAGEFEKTVIDLKEILNRKPIDLDTRPGKVYGHTT